jgi:hypothetical protein
MPPEHQYVVKNLWTSIVDLQTSIPILKGQIDTNKSAISAATNTVNNISTASQTVIEGGGSSDTIGAVNNQSGNTSYQTVLADYGAIIVFDDASPIAVTLSTLGSGQGIQLPFYCGVMNLGAGVVTLTPDSGQINNASTATIVDGGFGIIYFDGTNFWAQIATNNTGTITGVVAGTGLTGGGSSGSVTLSLVTPVSVADGGTGTATPGLVAGTGISVTGTWPDQTITSTGTSGVSSLNSLTGALSLTSTGSTITITPSGTNIDLEAVSSGYNLGGTLTSANLVFGPGAGTGPTLNSIDGLDGSHFIIFTTGSLPTTGTIWTMTLTASRGHNAYPVLTPTGASPISLTSTLITANTGGTSSYVIECQGTPLTAATAYGFHISCP